MSWASKTDRTRIDGCEVIRVIGGAVSDVRSIPVKIATCRCLGCGSTMPVYRDPTEAHRELYDKWWEEHVVCGDIDCKPERAS